MQLQAHTYWNSFLLTICSRDKLEDNEVPLILLKESEKFELTKRKKEKIQFVTLQDHDQ